MEEQLRPLLAKDEKLLWCGRPETFETLDKTNKPRILTGILIKTVLFAAMLCAYIRASLATDSFSILMAAAIAATGFLVIAYPFYVANSLRKKRVYGLTDRRILRLGENNETVPYSRIKTAALRTDADGHTSLLCGPGTVKLRPNRWRGKADSPFFNRPDKPEAEDVVLYALPMDKKLRSVLEEHLPIG